LLGSFAVRYTFGAPELGQSAQTGFDCSGFVRFVLLEAGLSIPNYIDVSGNTRQIRHANEFWDHYGVAVHSGLHQPGDLIFFTRCGFFPTHIGIVLDQENFIHSPGKPDTKVLVSAIREEIIESPSPPPRTRQIFLKNPIGFKAITIPIDEPNYRHSQRII
jgi:cell wall-associated NlpC family hydrolase